MVISYLIFIHPVSKVNIQKSVEVFFWKNSIPFLTWTKVKFVNFFFFQTFLFCVCCCCSCYCCCFCCCTLKCKVETGMHRAWTIEATKLGKSPRKTEFWMTGFSHYWLQGRQSFRYLGSISEHFRRSFYVKYSQGFFTLLESVCVKAAPKVLIKSILGGNFIIILRTTFPPILFQKLTEPNCMQ